MYGLGLVIGKFYPPHLGHSYLIQTALSECHVVYVLVCDSPRYSIDAITRAGWISGMHPEAIVTIIPDLNNDDDSQAWADHTIEYMGFSPDVVFSSEDYGIEYARLMGSSHVMVDKERTTYPISGTLVRSDVMEHWGYLDKLVRSDLATRIVCIGAESTGTTTLADSLAKHYQVPYVPEIGRHYAYSFMNTDHEWNETDFYNIVCLQRAYEELVVQQSNGFVICDTNAFATQVWQDRYLGYVTSNVSDIANTQTKVDLYIITGNEIPFVQDGTRDSEHLRDWMHTQIVHRLAEEEQYFICVKGDHESRMAESIKAIDEMLLTKIHIE